MARGSQQQDTHTKPDMLVEQEHQNSGDSSNQQMLRGRAQSSPAPSPRPPKTPKKKFQWFKGLKENLTKYTPSLSKVVQPSSSTASKNDQSIANSSMESTGAVHEGVTQGDVMDTKLSRMCDTEEPHLRDTEVPPEPKRNVPRAKTAETIISPEPQAETLVHSENQPDENSCPPQRGSTTQKESSDELHIPETKPLPVDLSTCVSGDGSTDDRTRSYSAPSPTMKKQLRNTRTSLSPTSDHTEGKEKGHMQSNIIPKRYRPHSGGHISPTPPASRGRGLSKHISGSTPHLTPAKLARPQWSSSVSHLACEERSGPKPSISDLIKPTALASRSRSSEGCVDAATQSSGDQHLGILKVHLKALDTSENFQSQSSSLPKRDCVAFSQLVVAMADLLHHYSLSFHAGLQCGTMRK